MWGTVKRSVVGNSDWVVCALLAVLGLWLVKGLDRKKPDEAIVVATLAGALFGGAAILFGNGINRANERRRIAEDLEQRRGKLKKLIAAELVNTAAGLLSTKPLIDSALEAAYDTRGSLHNNSMLTPISAPRHAPH